MSKLSHPDSFVASQEKVLLDLRDQLVDTMTDAQKNTLRTHAEGSDASASGVHTADAGSDAYDREFALTMLSKEQDALYEIDEALERIKRGCYGICEISGELIPIERLEAIPFARLTVESQTEWEKQYGSRRFFRDNDFGYTNGRVDEKSSRVFLDSQKD